MVAVLTTGRQSLLLERDAELAELERAVQDAARGAGRAVLVEGQAGAGKSSLLRHVVGSAAGAGLRVLRASGGELERDHAFGVMRQLLERAVGPALLNGSAAAAVFDPAGAAAEPGFGVLHALYWLVAGLAAEQPLLLAVDDLHWADDASLQAVDYIARRAGDLPLAIVGTLRPAEPGAHVAALDALRAQPDIALVRPAPLSPDAVAAIVGAARPGTDGAIAAAYHDASAGNPLYLRELLHAAPDADPEAIRAAAVPALGERVVRRVQRVAPEAPALAGAAALLGDGQPLALSAELAELDPAAAAEVARELVRIDVLATDDPAVFSHPVIRHSLYSELSSARRASMHAAAAERLDAARAGADAVAGHLMALPPAGSVAVAERLRAGGIDALARGAAGTAVRRLRRALEEGAAEPARAELLFDLGRAEAAGRDPECAAHLQEAFALAQGELKAQIACVLTEVLVGAGAWEAVQATMDEALPAAAPGSPAHGYLVASRAIMMANDPAHAERFFAAWDEYDGITRDEGWVAHAVAALLASQATFVGLPAERVRAYADRAREGERLLAEHGGGSWTAMQVAMALVALDDLDDAAEWAAAVAAVGRRTGAALHLFGSVAVEAWIAARRGDLLGAEASLRSLFELCVETGMTMWLTSVAYLFEDVIAERPSLDDIAALVLDVEVEPAFATTYAGALLREAQGRLLLARGDRTAAVRALRAMAGIYDPLRVGPMRSPWRSLLALAVDDPREARALADEELALARASDSPRALGIALRRHGVLHGDVDELREALAVLEETPAALEIAYTQLELGAALRRASQVAEAREHLADAADGARQCGAERLLARATDELLAAGARPRRVARTGREALTPRELRVAELAAAGRSNVEIAQDLFVSLKTVETHLSHVYAKLGLSGQGARSRLSGLLEDQAVVVE
jgi:ATP/maltotriose-dependent transcriptional regulator MalT